MKDFFGLLLVVHKRYSQYSEASKNSRAIVAATMIFMLYSLAFVFFMFIILSYFGIDKEMEYKYGAEAVRSALIYTWAGINLCFFIYLKFSFKDEVMKLYMEKFAPVSEKQSKFQLIKAFSFAIGGMLSVFIPILLISLFESF